jgi:hypothetical protein
MFFRCLRFISSQNLKLMYNFESLSLNTKQGSGVVRYTVLAPNLAIVNPVTQPPHRPIFNIV